MIWSKSFWSFLLLWKPCFCFFLEPLPVFLLAPKVEDFESFLVCPYFLFFSFLVFLEICLECWPPNDLVEVVTLGWALSSYSCCFLPINFSNCLPWGQHWSRSWLLADSILALALILIDFLTRSFQASCSQPFLSIQSLIDGLSLL